MHGLAVQIRHCKSVLKLKFKLAIMELWLTSPTETRSLWDCCYIKNIFTNDLGLHLSQYRATIRCFTVKSSKTKKEASGRGWLWGPLLICLLNFTLKEKSSCHSLQFALKYHVFLDSLWPQIREHTHRSSGLAKYHVFLD